MDTEVMLPNARHGGDAAQCEILLRRASSSEILKAIDGRAQPLESLIYTLQTDIELPKEGCNVWKAIFFQGIAFFLPPGDVRCGP